MQEYWYATRVSLSSPLKVMCLNGFNISSLCGRPFVELQKDWGWEIWLQDGCVDAEDE